MSYSCEVLANFTNCTSTKKSKKRHSNNVTKTRVGRKSSTSIVHQNKKIESLTRVSTMVKKKPTTVKKTELSRRSSSNRRRLKRGDNNKDVFDKVLDTDDKTIICKSRPIESANCWENLKEDVCRRTAIYSPVDYQNKRADVKERKSVDSGIGCSESDDEVKDSITPSENIHDILKTSNSRKEGKTAQNDVTTINTKSRESATLSTTRRSRRRQKHEEALELRELNREIENIRLEFRTISTNTHTINALICANNDVIADLEKAVDFRRRLCLSLDLKLTREEAKMPRKLRKPNRSKYVSLV